MPLLQAKLTVLPNQCHLLNNTWTFRFSSKHFEFFEGDNIIAQVDSNDKASAKPLLVKIEGDTLLLGESESKIGIWSKAFPFNTELPIHIRLAPSCWTPQLHWALEAEDKASIETWFLVANRLEFDTNLALKIAALI